MRITLPSTISPPRIRKDGSCSISFDTRELTAEEIFTIMSLRNTEGWLAYAPNQEDLEIPEETAQVEGKTESERLRAVLFVYYKQEVDAGRFVGLYDSFRKEKMEQIIQFVKNKLN